MSIFLIGLNLNDLLTRTPSISGYGKDQTKRLEDLHSDLGNNLALLLGVPPHKELHKSAQSELKVLLDYLRLEGADG